MELKARQLLDVFPMTLWHFVSRSLLCDTNTCFLEFWKSREITSFKRRKNTCFTCEKLEMNLKCSGILPLIIDDTEYSEWSVNLDLHF